MTNSKFTKTSEAVSIGHPDKVADQIADSIFDLLREYKDDAQSAVEVACGANSILIFGEIDKDVVWNNVNYLDKNEQRVSYINPELSKQITETATDLIRKIGYSQAQYNPLIILDLVVQSPEINGAVEGTEEKDPAAGDQGIVSGYATNETTDYHSLHFILAHRILERLEELRIDKTISFLLPDAKSQVTVEYEKNDKGFEVPVAIKHILVSQCHTNEVSIESLREILSTIVVSYCELFIPTVIVDKNVRAKLIESLLETEILINPAGSWNVGGPRADSGLLGRKLVVDNYGSAAPIGGGATSGKNLNKVDRSGAYYARNIAKSIVGSGLADKALVELSFAIGVPKPTSINIETFGTEKIPVEEIFEKVINSYKLDVRDMINLSSSIDKFVKTSKHGNYTNDSFPWEIIREL